MKRAIFVTVFAFVAVLAGAVSGFGQQADVTGEWVGAFNTPGGARPFKLVLAADGEKVTGVAKRSSGDVPIEGTLKGDRIEFSYTIVYGGNNLTLFYVGKVTGDTMAGSVSFGGQAEEGWTAKRTQK